MQGESRETLYRDRQRHEDGQSGKSLKSNPDLINKNSFLISYDGFDIDEELSLVESDIKWMVDNLRRAKRSANVKEDEQYNILERKLGKTCKNYKKLFESWSGIQIPHQKVINMQYQNIEQRKSGRRKENQMQQEYWNKPIDDMIKQLRKQDLSPEEIQAKRRKKKEQAKQEGDQDLESIGGDSDLSWEYDVEPGPLDQNAHLENLIQYISEELYLYVYLPSLLKVSIIGINEIDQVNERASIILKLQLKIRVPQNAEDDSDLYRHLSKLKIHVKSKKMKNEQENLATFLRKGQVQEQSPLFYGNSIENDEDAPFSIWTQFKDYYTLNNKFKEKSNDEVKKMLKRLEYFDGVIFSAYLKNVEVKINSYVFNAPFEMLDLNGYISVEEIQTAISDWQDDVYQYINYDLSLSPKLIIKPNLINISEESQNITHLVNAPSEIEIDDYELAEKLIKIEINDSDQPQYKMQNGLFGWRWKKIKERDEEDNNPKILYPGDSMYHFHFPIYRHPFKALGGIYIPTVVLGIINLFIFFQDSSSDGLADRIANIATLLISFVAMITVIQAEIKRTVLTVTSILIHAMILTPLLCLIQTMYLYFHQMEAIPLQSFLFWICVFITGLNFLYPFVLYLIYRCIWEPNFNLDEIRQNTIVLPGDHDLYEANKVEEKNYMPIKSLSSSSKIGMWEKSLSDFVKETLANTLQSDIFKRKLGEIARVFPKFHPFLSGKQGKIYQDILLSKKRSMYKRQSEKNR